MRIQWHNVKIADPAAVQRLRQVAHATGRTAGSLVSEAIWRLGAMVEKERGGPLPAFDGHLTRGSRIGNKHTRRTPRVTHGDRVRSLLVRSAGAIRTRDIAKEVGTSEKATNSILSRMVKAGSIERVSPGRYRVSGRGEA